jgi:hypothetical protein
MKQPGEETEILKNYELVIDPDGQATLYLTHRPRRMPAGFALVHNNVKPPPSRVRKLGANGFRAWLALPGEHLAACRCGWAAELGEHYVSAC